MKFEVAQIGNPVLRQLAEPIVEINDFEMQALIDGLIETLQCEKGVGIAAPQVSISKQILIIASYPNERYPNAPKMEPNALINPSIVAMSKEMEKGWEGCLSVPGIRGLVPRHRWVQVEYQNRRGEHCVETFEGFVARIFQHEYDHLIGKTYLDRVESNTDIISELEYRKLVS